MQIYASDAVSHMLSGKADEKPSGDPFSWCFAYSVNAMVGSNVQNVDLHEKNKLTLHSIQSSHHEMITVSEIIKLK